MVAGFDGRGRDGTRQVFEFTVPDTTEGPQLPVDFYQERFLARPPYNDASDEVRAEFGLLTTDQHDRRLDLRVLDPNVDLSGSYSLADSNLATIAAIAADRVRNFTVEAVDLLDREGTGGHWRVCRVRPGHEVEESLAPWGPMRADDPG